MVLLEAPASKPVDPHQLLKLKCYPEQFSLWVPVGIRLDLLHALGRTVQRMWPERQIYTACLGQKAPTTRKGRSRTVSLGCLCMETSPQLSSTWAGAGASRPSVFASGATLLAAHSWMQTQASRRAHQPNHREVLLMGWRPVPAHPASHPSIDQCTFARPPITLPPNLLPIVCPPDPRPTIHPHPI